MSSGLNRQTSGGTHGHSRQGSGGTHGHSRQGSGGTNGHSRQHSGSIPPAAANVQNVKLVLLGDQSVGKSSIALRFVRGEFTENAEATIGAAFLTQTISVSNQTVKFDIWDTAGQERYHSLAPMYYRGAQAAVIVYDITNTKSFNKAIRWVRELKQQANAHIVIVMAGNKADMAAEKRAVSREEVYMIFTDLIKVMFTDAEGEHHLSREVYMIFTDLIKVMFTDAEGEHHLSREAQSFAEENNLVFTESSAKTGMCVGDIFMTIAQALTRNTTQADDSNKGLKLGNEKEPKKKEGKGCC